MSKKHDEVIANTFGFLVPFSIIIIAIATTAAVFLIGIREYQAREAAIAVKYVKLDQPAEIIHDKKVLAVLPINKTISQSPDIQPNDSDKIIKKLASRLLTLNNTTTADSILIDVPFTPQAPFGEWHDPRQNYGCEEASLLMVWHHVNNQPLSLAQAKAEITALSDWELKTYGEFRDSSAMDTVKIFREYFQYNDVRLVYDISIENIKAELAAGNPVIVPLDGQVLDNPYYTPPGPLHHMLVVVGYDDKTGELITNDPGTKRGHKIRYTYDNFYSAIRDYETDQALPVTEIRKPMIVIE